jgi:hypothetical protein
VFPADIGVSPGMYYLTPLLAAAGLAVTAAAVLWVKSGRRYRGRHVRRGLGRHGRPCGSDPVDRVLSAMARVDAWILIATIVGVVIGCLTLVKH